jgi:hypothetical protein
MSKEIVEIEVFHGTDLKNFKLIQIEGFKSSSGSEHDEWLGDGVYFFTNGVPPKPEVSAEKWAITEAWNNNLYKNDYTRYAVIKVIAQIDNSKFLDLTTWDGLEIFNYLRDKYIEKLRSARKKLKHGEFKDGHIVNHVSIEIKNIEIDAVRGNFYFKFSEERRCNAQFKTPNCTVIAIKNVNCIKQNSIQLYKSNTVK